MSAMDPKPLELSLTCWTEGQGGASTENPSWSTIEGQIESVFESGGNVELSAVRRVFEPQESLLMLETISMLAKPGGFRLVVTPARVAGQRKSNQREWWEEGDTAYRGLDRFRGHDWDSRTICADVGIAKWFFKEFFDNRGVTRAIVDRTLSVWDAKPRA